MKRPVLFGIIAIAIVVGVASMSYGTEAGDALKISAREIASYIHARGGPWLRDEIIAALTEHGSRMTISTKAADGYDRGFTLRFTHPENKTLVLRVLPSFIHASIPGSVRLIVFGNDRHFDRHFEIIPDPERGNAATWIRVFAGVQEVLYANT